jgi:N-acetylmuramoyl-L-alanine amidase
MQANSPGTRLPRRFRNALLPLSVLIVGTILLFWPARLLHSDNFVIYFPKERHIVRLEVIDGANYLPVLDVLNAVGKVSGFEEKRNSVVVWFGGSQLQLKKDDKKVKVGRSAKNLPRPVRVSNGQWMVPADFLSSVLPEVIHQRVAYQVGEKRAFIGDVKPVTFTADLEPLSNGVRLTLQFTDPVTARTASQNGKWIVFLGNEPFEAPAHMLRFQNPYLSALQFDDQDGVPKLLLTPGSDGLNFYPAQPSRSKFIVEVAKPAPKLAQLPASASPSAAHAPVPPPPPVPPLLPVVVLDPGHGGTDAGARSRDGLLEKDVVAAWAERVRLALVATNKYRIVVTRSGNADPGFDERAGISNGAGPVAFLSLHAGNLGAKLPQLVVYTYLPSSRTEGLEETRAAAGVDRSGVVGERLLLLPWNDVQQVHVVRSRQLAQALDRQFGRVPGLTAGEPAEAPVRALRSIDAPAAAIEIGSFAPDVDARPLTNSAFQDQIAGAIVRALEAFLGGQA